MGATIAPGTLAAIRTEAAEVLATTTDPVALRDYLASIVDELDRLLDEAV
jgi:hypothetical protein